MSVTLLPFFIGWPGGQFAGWPAGWPVFRWAFAFQFVKSLDSVTPVKTGVQNLLKILTMRHNYLKILVYLLFFLLMGRDVGLALELHTRYAVIVYNEDRDLDRFNEEIYIGKYNFLLQQEGIHSVADEVRLKIDLILDRVKEILNMFPEHENIKIILCSSDEDIRNIHQRIYGQPNSSTAFYAPDMDMVFFSSSDVELTTVAHEFAHVVMEKYFQTSPPVKIHELLSRYAARHIKD